MAKDEKGSPPAQADSLPPDLSKERERLLRFFPQGAKLTEEFVREHERLLSRLVDLEAENARLRARVGADEAARDLLDTIQRLESERDELLSRYRQAQQVSTSFHERFAQVETEFTDMVNLFVASIQLHSSMSPRRVTRRIKEVLVQLVGAERFCIYLANPDGSELVPIASEGVTGDELVPLPTAEGAVGEAYRSAQALVNDTDDPSCGTIAKPAAVVPMSIDDTAVGVIAVFSTLEQKTKFDQIDFELFKLVGQHAAGALVSASLFVQAERKIPGLEAFLDLSL